LKGGGYLLMLKNKYTKKYLGYDYSLYNHGCTGTQAKRNRRLGTHIIRSKQKRELQKEMNEYLQGETNEREKKSNC